jgi:hypothetical protein
MLLTMPSMPDLKWTVLVKNWRWVYTFSRGGAVSWLDPFNKMTGKGTWRIQGHTMKVSWVNSKTTEEWDVPLNPLLEQGVCHMAEGSYALKAWAMNFYLEPGDVVYVGQAIQRGNGTVASVIYPDEVRTGGTVAWICRNPGNIREGEKYGAYKGKRLNVRSAGAYAIFPDETTGLMAVVSVLRAYGRVTLSQAMHKYAPSTDGSNRPDDYAGTLAGRLRVSVNTYLPTLSDEQMLRLAFEITGVEHTAKGTPYPLSSPALPGEIRQRLPGYSA